MFSLRKLKFLNTGENKLPSPVNMVKNVIVYSLIGTMLSILINYYYLSSEIIKNKCFKVV